MLDEEILGLRNDLKGFIFCERGGTHLSVVNESSRENFKLNLTG